MIFLIVVANDYVLITVIGALPQNHDLFRYTSQFDFITVRKEVLDGLLQISLEAFFSEKKQ